MNGNKEKVLAIGGPCAGLHRIAAHLLGEDVNLTESLDPTLPGMERRPTHRYVAMQLDVLGTTIWVYYHEDLGEDSARVALGPMIRDALLGTGS